MRARGVRGALSGKRGEHEPYRFLSLCNSSSVIPHLSLQAINGLQPRSTLKSYLRILASEKDLRSRVHTQGTAKSTGPQQSD